MGRNPTLIKGRTSQILTAGALNAAATFSRASVATFFSNATTVTDVAANVARYNSAGRLLIEDTRLNNIIQSRTGSDLAWTKTNGTFVGTTFTATAALATALQATVLASVAYTFGTYIKRVTGTGAVSITLDGGTTWTVVTGLTSVYQYYSITQTVLNPSVGFKVDVLGDAIDIEMSALEAAAFGTTGTSTAAATVTRAVESATMPVAGFLSPSAGTLVGTFMVRQTGTAVNQGMIRIDDGSNVNRVQLFVTLGSNTVSSRVITGGVVVLGATAAGTVTAGVAFKAAIAWQENNFGACLNGGAVNESLSGLAPPGLSTIRLGRSGISAELLNGEVGSVTYYPRRLSNAELQTLTL